MIIEMQHGRRAAARARIGWIGMTAIFDVGLCARVIFAAAAILWLVSLPGVAVAQTSDSSSAAATAEVITPISLTNTTPLLFGSIVPTGAPGTVTIDANTGARSASNVDVLPVTGAPSRSIGTANFNVAGEPGFSYTIGLPTSINIASGGDSMTVDMFTNKAVNLGTLSVGGADSFSVGARLNVGATQPPGTYAGTFNATVTYD